MRYFTNTNAIEYNISPIELRKRYPHTGLLIEDDLITLLDKNIKPVQFDIKGNYGVSIIWSDNYATDIFPFDVLQQIAIELADKN